MHDTDDAGNNRKTEARDRALIRLLQTLFSAHFCPAVELADDQRGRVDPETFYAWLNAHWGDFDPEAVSDKAGTGPESWDLVREMLNRGIAAAATREAWFSITLGGRPAPPSPVYSINLLCNVTFEDGVVYTTKAFVSKELYAGPEMDDVVAFTVLRDLARRLLAVTSGTGLAGMHAEAAVRPFRADHPNDPFDVLTGWVVEHMIRGKPVPGRLDPALVQPVATFLALARECIRPDIPPEAVAAYKQRQAQEAAKAAGSVRGGWNG